MRPDVLSVCPRRVPGTETGEGDADDTWKVPRLQTRVTVGGAGGGAGGLLAPVQPRPRGPAAAHTQRSHALTGPEQQERAGRGTSVRRPTLRAAEEAGGAPPPPAPSRGSAQTLPLFGRAQPAGVRGSRRWAPGRGSGPLSL